MIYPLLHTGLRKVLLCLFSILTILAGEAQRYSFKNFTTNDGLVQTDITDIKQDKKGNIWIGTNGGISIYDGRKFTNYDDHDRLQSLRINALLCDSTGIMWVATANGLLRYENDFEVFFQMKNARMSGITSLTSNSKNLLLFVCNSQLYQVKGKNVTPFALRQDLQEKISMAAFDKDDNLWLVTNDLKIYRKTFDQYTPIKTGFTEEGRQRGLGMIRVLGKEGPVPYFVTNFGTMWARGDSLCYFTQQYPRFRETRVGAPVYVLEENDSTVWVGGTVGMAKLTEHTSRRYNGDNGFCDNSVSCLFTDKEKNLWVGCTYNGVYKLSNEALFHVKPANESVDLRHVTEIAPIAPGRTLVGTWGRGVFLQQGDSVLPVTSLPPQVRYITNLFPFGDHTYVSWFGPGIWRVNNQTLNVTAVKQFAGGEAIDRMFRVKGQLVIQSLNGKCYITDQDFEVKKVVTLPDSYGVVVLRDECYQVGPTGQVDQLNTNLQVIRRNIFPEVNSRITEIICHRDQYLVATFGQGVFLYNQWGKLVKKLDKKSGLNTNIVTSLLADGNRLFLGTNLGMIRAELPHLTGVKIFRESEGMFNWECRPGGLRKLPDGAIMIATTNGPYRYYPANDLAGNLTLGTISIASFSYGTNQRNPVVRSFLTTSASLPTPIDYKDNAIAITLSGVSHRDPEGILYHYQLSGYDSGSVATSNPVIRFNGLQPGSYVFKSYLTVGNYQSPPVSLSFIVDKPLSGRLWFQALLVLALSLVSWLLLSAGNRLYQKYIQTRMVGQLETEIAAKQQLTAQSISFAQKNYKELSEALKHVSNEAYRSSLTPVFLKDVSKRIALLWNAETISVGELHRYFDDLVTEYGSGATIYHKYSADDRNISMSSAFHVLQVFSLYLFIGLYENGTAVFSLDSEEKSNGDLLVRFYKLNRENNSAKLSTYHFLKEAIDTHQHDGAIIDIIENLEYGNMLVAEINVNQEVFV